MRFQLKKLIHFILASVPKFLITLFNLKPFLTFDLDCKLSNLLLIGVSFYAVSHLPIVYKFGVLCIKKSVLNRTRLCQLHLNPIVQNVSRQQVLF